MPFAKRAYDYQPGSPEVLKKVYHAYKSGGIWMATIKDVAKEAGLAVGTVSRVMNNRGYISDSARKKVEEAMKKLNYHPNEMARSLQKKYTNTIGVIVPIIDHPYFAKLVSCLVEEAYRQDKKILLLSSGGLETREAEFIELCHRNLVSGIILCNGSINVSSFDNLHIPVITIERKKEGDSPSIECDNWQGGVLAVEHLVERGCRNLLHVSGQTEKSMPADVRGNAFLETCARKKVQGRVIRRQLKHYQLEDSDQFIGSMLDQFPDTDGIFVSNDIMAVMILEVCKKRGLNIPEDIRIVGFDDLSITCWTYPQISTIHQPIEEMAREALDTLEQMQKKKSVPSRIVLPVSLVVRGSS